MSIKKVLCSILLSCIINAIAGWGIYAQTVCDDVFMKEYTSVGNIEPYTTKSLSNDEILVAGRGTLVAGGNYKAMAVKMSSNGSVIWSIMTGGNIEDRFTGITLLADGSYLLYGTSFSFGYPGGKILMVCISANGNILWSKQIGLTSSSADRIKAIKQFSDGDIIGTFNTNDSTSQSDPVVFKMGLNGSFKWMQQFDNNAAESFTSIGFQNNKIYVSGFYTDIKKYGVLTILNSLDGSISSSQKLYLDSTSDEEVTNMEVYNNKISYGLWINGSNQHEQMLLIQEDINYNKSFETLIDDFDNKQALFSKRTADDGFLLLFSMDNAGYTPDLMKLNRFNAIEWTTFQANYDFYRGQQNKDADITPNGGGVSAGYFSDYSTSGISRMIVVKTSRSGETGSCSERTGNTFFDGETNIIESPFSWANESLIANFVNQNIAPDISNFNAVENRLCDTTYCTDITPLPPGCNKTSLVEYGSSRSTVLRDFVTTKDGGKIAVGDMGNGFITKIKDNGDVAWAKLIDTVDGIDRFVRVIKANDNNVFAFANGSYTLNHYGYGDIKIVKMDDVGNILISKDVTDQAYIQVSDVFATKDGGFVLILNEDYGSGYIYSGVMRFDANLQVVWKKQIAHAVITPILRSVFCTDDAVYIGGDSYDNYNTDKINIQKLDFATGKNIWGKRFVFANDFVRLNKLIISDDSIYAFINNLTPINPFMSQYGTFLLKLTNTGAVVNAVSLQGEQLTYKSLYDYIDEVRPTVTITPAKDFVMSNQVQAADGSTQLNISKFNKKGETIWSKDYPGMSVQYVYNIHSQATGLSVIGTATRPHVNSPSFNNDFIFKVDSLGEVLPNATGTCAFKAVPLSTSQISVQETDSGIDSVVDLQNFQNNTITLLAYDVPFDATMYCNQKQNCPTVVLGGNTNICRIKDTLVYYLANNNCAATATWQYDTAYFKFVSSSTDSLKLLPSKTGTSFIKADITDACSEKIDSIPVSVLVSASSLNLGRDTSICQGSTLKLRAGPGYTSYLWSTSGTDSVITVSMPGTYFVKVTDNCGVMATDSIIVSGIQNTFHIYGDSVKCNADSAILFASPGFSNYQWSPQVNITSTGDTAKVAPLQTTLYYVAAEKFIGCTVKDSFLVTVTTSPPIYLGNDTSFCSSQSVLLNAGSGFANYLWSTGETTSTIIATQKGSYSVKATALNSCISKDTLQVLNVSPLPQFTLGNDTTLCSGSLHIYHFAIANASYLWNDGSTSPDYTITRPDVYWLTVTQQGCAASDTVLINYKSSPTVYLGADTTVCNGTTVLLNAAYNNASYLWQDGSLQPDFLVDHAGMYHVTVNLDGCTAKDTIQITYIAKPVFTLGNDTVLCEGTTIRLQPHLNEPAAYLWQDGSTQLSYTVNAIGTYKLTVTNTCGSATDDITITPGLCNIMLPNAFTPNGDGLNDIFRVKYPFSVTSFLFTIYNRFGQRVFEAKDITRGWNGNYNAMPQPAGAYVWTIQVINNTNAVQSYKGVVTLIR